MPAVCPAIYRQQIVLGKRQYPKGISENGASINKYPYTLYPKSPFNVSWHERTLVL